MTPAQSRVAQGMKTCAALGARWVAAAAMVAVLGGALTPSARGQGDVASAPMCAGTTVYVSGAPTTPAAARQLSTWLNAWSPAALDAPLMDRRAIDNLNWHNSRRGGAWRDVIDGPARSAGTIAGEIAERQVWMLGRLTGGHYVEDIQGSYSLATERALGAWPVDELRVVTRGVDVRCMPQRSGLYTPAMDLDFDRNQCSAAHMGEVVRVGRVSQDGLWRYVHTGHSVGWIEGDEALTPPLSADAARRFRDAGSRLVAIDDWVPTSTGGFLRMGIDVPVFGRTAQGQWHIQLPTRWGLQDAYVHADDAVVAPALPALTRRNVFTTVFARLDDPYGWGGTGRGRDCSRLLLDTLGTFGVRLGRNSSVQSRAGAVVIDVADLNEQQKLAAIVDNGRKGIVFLYMPGHIMLYLGQLDGVPYAISAISEIKLPCPGGGDQTLRLDRVEVTDLDVGRGTQKTAFIQRMTRIAVFGP